jgi:hypothetical protein
MVGAEVGGITEDEYRNTGIQEYRLCPDSSL